MQTIKDLRHGDAFIEKEFIINHEQISIASHLRTSTTSWNAVKKIREKYETYYLYVNSTEAIILPKRYLSEDDVSYFKSRIFEMKV